ncbi:MAG TPA: YceI family protein [Bryobacteraceae bacterium]|nr:YceI family protein [Bryobacteraceae bacterium]
MNTNPTRSAIAGFWGAGERRAWLPIALLVATLTPAFADNIAVHFDPAHTEVNFTLSDVLHTVHGIFHLKTGDIQFDPATGKATGRLVVDAASGDSGSKARDGRMHRNILESSKFTEITFTPDRVDGKVTLDGDSQVQVHGTFNLHGSAHELTIPVQVHAANQQVTVATRFNVPYVKWGLKNPSTLFLRVGDQVQIDIRAAGTITSTS